MATRKQLIDDIVLRIYSGKPSDDIELEDTQIAYWIDFIRNGMVAIELNRASSKNKLLSSIYQIRETDKQLVKETGVNYDFNDTDFRYFTTTEKDVLPLDNNRGIVRINDNYGRNLSPIDVNSSDWMQNLPYGGVTTAKQSFYLEEGNKVFIETSTESTKDFYYYDIVYIPMVSTDTVLDTDEYPIEEQLIEPLLEKVEAVARRQMSGVSDLDNDGKDPHHN